MEYIMKGYLVAVLLSTALMASAANAQMNQPSQNPSGSASTAAPPPIDKNTLKGSWRASKLIGLNVYNEGNEKLGDISELIVDKDGKIKAVVIGVGGFLGLGEHDIAVQMDQLKFVEEPARTSSSASTSSD